MTATLLAPYVIDIDLARRADRKLRRFGSDLNRVLSVIVTFHGVPDFVAPDKEPQPLDAHDPRIEKAVASATVRRIGRGRYRAETPADALYYADALHAEAATPAPTRKARPSSPVRSSQNPSRRKPCWSARKRPRRSPPRFSSS